MEARLEIGDYLLIAELILGESAESIAAACRIPEAESALAAPWAGFGGQMFYPDPVERGGILCSRLNRNHPLPDGNKRAAFEAMREQLHREGIEWKPTADIDEIVDAVEMLAARCVSEEDFIAWLSKQVA